MDEPILSCRNLTFCYEDKPIVSGVSLSVRRGEAVLLMGPSGCGKSSLAYCLAGLYPSYAGTMTGEILLAGRPLAEYGASDRAQCVSILFQNPDNQFCMDRVDHEILFALENINYRGDLYARMRELLAMVGLEAVEQAAIYTLSGGTKQKLALATAMATGAKLLILDEPFANLDPGACAELSARLAQLNRQGLTLLVVDHRVDYWRPFLSRILLMNKDGTLSPEQLSPQELEAHREAFTARGLFLDDSWLQSRRSPALPQPEQAAVEGENISLLHGKKVIASGLTFSFPKGGITALVGKNGSGKTTLLTAIAGAGKYKGALRIAGEVGLVFQNPRFQFLARSVEDEVLTTLRSANPKTPEEELVRRSHTLLDEFGLLEWKNHSPYAISQGQQRRLALLAMLAGDRPVLLLDEPTYAQDQRATAFILELLSRRVAQGLSAVIATHDLALAQCCANRIYLLEDGRMQLLSQEELARYAQERRAPLCEHEIPPINY